MFNSYSQEEEQIIQESTKTTIEPDFFEAGGSMNKTEVEEEAPQNNSNAKTYSYYNYTLLKPSDLNQKKVNEIKCGETKIMPLLVGSKKKKVGLIKVSNDDENLYITVKTNENKYIKKLYLLVIKQYVFILEWLPKTKRI